MKLNETYTAAYTATGKPAKAKALELVRDLIRHDTEGTMARELAPLLKFFAAPAPKAPKDAFTWVAQCATRAQKDRRVIVLRYVYCDDEYMVATDGAVLLYAPRRVDMESGCYYDPATGATVEPDARFPNWQQATQRYEQHADNATLWTPGARTPHPVENYGEVYAVSDRRGVDAALIDIAHNGDPDCTFQWSAETDAMLVTHKYGKGVIMPMQV